MRRHTSIFNPPPLNAPWKEHGAYVGQMTQYLMARRIGGALVKFTVAGLSIALAFGVLFLLSSIAAMRGV